MRLKFPKCTGIVPNRSSEASERASEELLKGSDAFPLSHSGAQGCMPQEAAHTLSSRRMSEI